VSVDPHVEQSDAAQHIEDIKAIATAETMKEHCAVAVSHTQAWIAVPPTLAMWGDRAMAKEALAIALAAQSTSNGCCIGHGTRAEQTVVPVEGSFSSLSSYPSILILSVVSGHKVPDEFDVHDAEHDFEVRYALTLKVFDEVYDGFPLRVHWSFPLFEEGLHAGLHLLCQRLDFLIPLDALLLELS
jgi:hypothetical protein